MQWLTNSGLKVNAEKSRVGNLPQIRHTTAVSFYDLIKKEIPEEDWINMQFNFQNDRRNTRLKFQTNNTYRCGPFKPIQISYKRDQKRMDRFNKRHLQNEMQKTI